MDDLPTMVLQPLRQAWERLKGVEEAAASVITSSGEQDFVDGQPGDVSALVSQAKKANAIVCQMLVAMSKA